LQQHLDIFHRLGSLGCSITDIRYRDAVYQEMGKWLKGVFPCSTGLVVPALARPEWVVEIEVTAVIPE